LLRRRVILCPGCADELVSFLRERPTGAATRLFLHPVPRAPRVAAGRLARTTETGPWSAVIVSMRNG